MTPDRQPSVSPPNVNAASETSIEQTAEYSTDPRDPTPNVDRSEWPTIPGYTITAEIARGGMGRVFAGRDLTLERDVAIKTLLPGARADRFITESKITARLPHPGIPPVHALGTLDHGTPYLVMKWVRGRTLAELLKERSSALDDLPRFVQILEQIAQAVGFAHAQGIIHRDLKPLNVMVGAFGEVQVMDWGLAKAFGSAEGEQAGETGSTPTHTNGTDLTAAGSVLGTPGFMSPEQARGEAMDTRTDVFALGAILCQILTQQPPFTQSNHFALLRQTGNAELGDAFARLDGSGADAELIAMAKHCLAGDAKDRPATATIVAEEIAAFRARVETRLREAESQRAVDRAKLEEQRKRRRAMQWAGASIIAVLLLGIIGTSVGLAQANSARAGESRRADSEGQAKREAEVAAFNEKQAKEQTEKRLEQLATNNLILGSIFHEINLRKLEQQGDKLELLLGKRLKVAAAQLKGEAVGDPLVVAQLQHTLGASLLGLDHYDEAIEQLKAAVETRSRLLSPDHEFTLQSSNDLAEAYMLSGQLDRALPLYEETLRLTKARFGGDDRRALTSMSNLASLYMATGKGKQSLKLWEETLERRKKLFGDEDEDTLLSMNNLAWAYQDDDRFDLALPLIQQAHERTKAKFGSDNPQTLMAQSNLALITMDAGKLEEALPLFQDTLRRRRAKLGDDNPDTLSSINGLALCLRQMGKPEAAVPLFEEALATMRVRLSPDHPMTIVTAHNLALGYQDTDRLSQALPLFEQASTAIEKRRYQHEHAGKILPNTIAAYEEAGEYEKADSWRRKWLAVVKAQAGAESIPYASELATLSLSLLNRKKWSEAEIELRECLAIRQKKQPDVWSTFNTQSSLGGALLGQKKYADAEPLLLKGYEGMKAREKTIPPAGAERIPDAIDRLIELYTATKKPDEVKKWQAERAKYSKKKDQPEKK